MLAGEQAEIYEQHSGEITVRQAAKRHVGSLGLKKLPTIMGKKRAEDRRFYVYTATVTAIGEPAIGWYGFAPEKSMGLYTYCKKMIY